MICLRNSSCCLSEAVQTACSSDIFYTAADGKRHFPPSSGYRHGTATPSARSPLNSFTPSAQLWQIDMLKKKKKNPQESVLLCFQTRSDSNYHKIYCTTRGEAVIYFGSRPKWKTPSQSLSSLCAGPQTPHGGAGFRKARL